jgi:hypothetical protein
MDLTGFDKYIVTIHSAFECQEIEIINGEEATEAAQRLRSFLRGSFSVTLDGYYGGEAVFDNEGEYSHHVNERREALAF